MRQIVAVRVDNGNLIHIIANVEKPEDARKIAADNSARLIGNKSLMITTKSPIVSSEKWEQERVTPEKYGNRLYKVAFYMDNITQCLDIGAVSIKSAYNNIKNKFGIQDDLFMIIYEMNQSHRRKGAVGIACNILNNKELTNKQLKIAASKIPKTEYLSKHTSEVKTTFALIRASQSKVYNNIDDKSVLCLMSAIVYFNNPYETEPNINPGLLNMDGESVLIWAIQQNFNEIVKYSSWVNNRE